MKKIGLIGGITPESTILYYRLLNKFNTDRMGGSHSANLIINSFDFGEIAKLQNEDRWDLLDEIMSKTALNLESAGADCIIICANTMHLCIEAVKKVVKIPVIHIAEETAKKIVDLNIEKVALLGTRYTMERAFFKDVLLSFGINTIIPNISNRMALHQIIYSELSKGVIRKSSKEQFLSVINNLIAKGAKGVILGCTEIPLLINQSDVDVPIFDTTKIHAKAAFDFAIT